MAATRETAARKQQDRTLLRALWEWDTPMKTHSPAYAGAVHCITSAFCWVSKSMLSSLRVDLCCTESAALAWK